MIMNRTRQFSWNRPILYNGSLFPTATMPVEDSKGNIADTPVFADANGMYHSLDSKGNEFPVILQQSLPEVEIRPQRKRKELTNGASDYIITPEVVDEISNRKAILRAAGYNIPKGSSWDAGLQALWNKLTTKQKEYDTTLIGLAEGLWDKINSNDTFFVNPFDQGHIRKYNHDNVDWSKTRKSQSKIINAIQGTWAPVAGVATAFPALMTAPIASVVGGIGGLVGGQIVNKASKALTGRDIGTNVAIHTPLTPELGEMLNPGYAIGGIGAEKRMLDAVYNQVTPIGYTNDNTFMTSNAIPKTKELALAIKDFITPKRINTSTTVNPAWLQRAFSDPSILQVPKSKGRLMLRDDAWRLALRQKPRKLNVFGEPHSLYIKNPDGTYRYDLDYINKLRSDIGMDALSEQTLPIMTSIKQLRPGKNNVVVGESIGYNGGYSGMEFSLPDNWITTKVKTDPYSGKIKLDVDNPFRLYDRWDIQPLKDQYRSFIPPVTKFANEHPNVFTNYLKNAEGLQWIGGNPFMLDMSISPSKIGDITVKP